MYTNLTEFIKKGLTDSKISQKRFFLQRDNYRLRKYTFSDIYRYSLSFACFLKDYGIGQGEKVILKGPNCPEWVIAFLGIILRGAVAVPLDAKSDSDFDIKIAVKAEARAVVSDFLQNSHHFDVLKLVNIPLSGLKELLEDKLTKDESFLPEIKPEDLIEIVFTSGTKAEPKGVKISAKNIGANLGSIIPVMQRYGRFFKIMIHPKILSVVPLSHLYGQLIGIYTPIMINSSVIFMQGINPQRILKVIREEKIWILATLPKLLELLKEHIIEKLGLDNKDFRQLFERMKKFKWQLRLLRFGWLHIKLGIRLVAFMVGGAVLEPSVDEFFRCIAYSIFQGYGLTETAPIITLSDPIAGIAGSVGRVLNGQEFKIVDGEIYVKGENVSQGYYKDDISTQKSFEGGWFKTGDLAEMDKSGNVFFRGRKDDVIVRSDGINIYPSDIEAAIKEYQEVKDCAVVGVKAGGQDRIYAFIALKNGAGTYLAEIIKAVNKKLSVYQKIDGFFLIQNEDFPRTSTMKIKKGPLLEFLKNKFNEDAMQGTSSEKTEDKKSLAYKINDLGKGLFLEINSFYSENKKILDLKEIIRSIGKTAGRTLKISDRLEDDAGLDSINIIQLSSAIEERFNVRIDDSLINSQTKIADIEKMLSQPQATERQIPFYGFAFWLPVKIFRTIFQFILYPFISMLYILKVRGLENLKDIKEPVVFASNHTSNLDAFVILYSLPLHLRFNMAAVMSIEHHFRHFFYKKGSLFKRIIEAIGFYLLVNLAIGALPLSRTHGFRQSLENIGRLLDRGNHILIFPEGGVTSDGTIKNFENGIGIIASDMYARIVPVKIAGLYGILKNGIIPWGHLPKWPRVNVTFAEPQ
ncbi:MAG: AMP-binding protein, partial [Actinobacteria bacterium]|nr:AMP-binding protein [Actinomycetota bacterium]